MAAMLNDEEYARQVLEARKRKGLSTEKSEPSLATWSPIVSAIADAIDSIRENTAVAVAAAGGAAKAPARYDRPRTAFQRVAMQMREEAHRSLVARVLPRD